MFGGWVRAVVLIGNPQSSSRQVSVGGADDRGENGTSSKARGWGVLRRIRRLVEGTTEGRTVRRQCFQQQGGQEWELQVVVTIVHGKAVWDMDVRGENGTSSINSHGLGLGSASVTQVGEQRQRGERYVVLFNSLRWVGGCSAEQPIRNTSAREWTSEGRTVRRPTSEPGD